MTFRRKELLKFVQNDIERVRLTYPTTEIVIYNMAKDKPKPSWKIRYPIEAEADQNEVRSLMFRLEDLKALGIIDPGPERDSMAKTLTTPKLKVTLHTTAGDQSVRLYQPDPQKGEAIAETAPDAPLYRINPGLIRDLTKDLFILQDKRLFGLDYTDVAMLSVKTRDQEYVLINQSGEWVLEDQPTEKVSQEVADLFVSRVANLPAEERVMKQSGPLAPMGSYLRPQSLSRQRRTARPREDLRWAAKQESPLCNRPTTLWFVSSAPGPPDPDSSKTELLGKVPSGTPSRQ